MAPRRSEEVLGAARCRAECPAVGAEPSDTLDGPLIEKAGNRNGYILEISEEGDDAAKTPLSRPGAPAPGLLTAPILDV